MSTFLLRWNDQRVLELAPLNRIPFAPETQLELTSQNKLLVHENQSRRSFFCGEVFDLQNEIFALVDGSQPVSLLTARTEFAQQQAFPLISRSPFDFLKNALQQSANSTSNWNRKNAFQMVCRLVKFSLVVFTCVLAWSGVASQFTADAPELARIESADVLKTRMFVTARAFEKQIEDQELMSAAKTRVQETNAGANASLNSSANGPGRLASNSQLKLNDRTRARHTPCLVPARTISDPDVLRFLSQNEKIRLQQRWNKSHKNAKDCAQ